MNHLFKELADNAASYLCILGALLVAIFAQSDWFLAFLLAGLLLHR